MRAIRAFHSANRGRVRSAGTGRHIGEAPALWERPPREPTLRVFGQHLGADHRAPPPCEPTLRN